MKTYDINEAGEVTPNPTGDGGFMLTADVRQMMVRSGLYITKCHSCRHWIAGLPVGPPHGCKACRRQAAEMQGGEA